MAATNPYNARYHQSVQTQYELQQIYDKREVMYEMLDTLADNLDDDTYNAWVDQIDPKMTVDQLIAKLKAEFPKLFAEGNPDD